MGGNISHGTFRKKSRGNLQWFFSFQFMVSVFGAVILISLIALAVILKGVRDENRGLHVTAGIESRNSLHAIDQRVKSLKHQSELLEARVLKTETRVVNTSPGEDQQMTAAALRALIRLLKQHEAETSEVDELMEELPEDQRKLLSRELEVSEPGTGQRGGQADASGAEGGLDSGPVEAHGSDVALEAAAIQESAEQSRESGGLVEYRVQPGDTLSGIALLHGAPVDRILELNGLGNPNRIRVGSLLRIPSPGETPQD